MWSKTKLSILPSLLGSCKTLNALGEAKAVHSHKMSTAVCLDVSPTLLNNLIKPIIKSDGLSSMHKLYDKMSEWDVVSWTSLILKHSQRGFGDQSLTYFSLMRRFGIEPNEITFSTLVGICSSLRRIYFGMSLHCLILKKGSCTQLFISSALIKLYSKFDQIKEARQVFDEMPEKDAVSWNSMIAAYAQNEFCGEAISLFSLMLENSFNQKNFMNSFTLASVLKACAGFGCVRIGKSIHNYVIKLGIDLDAFVVGSVIDMYSKCGSSDLARRVFDRMGKRDLIVWNAMIAGYTQNSCSNEAIELFYMMQYEQFPPNHTTFTSVLKALSEVADGVLGRTFHAKTIKGGCLLDVFVSTALVDMYSKCLDMEDASRAFEEMQMKNLESFNALITGYSLTGRYTESLKAYIELRIENMAPDSFTFSSLLSSCLLLGALFEGTEIHAHSIKFGLDSDIYVGNSLVNLYSKCGLMDRASKAFEYINMPNVISWAGIISGFTNNGEGENAVKYFCKGHKLSQKLDEFSSTSVLKAMANWAAMEQGKHMHAHVIKTGLESTVFVGSALVDMYSKCGMAKDSFEVFTNLPEKNVVSWNSMIVGYAQNGFSEKSLYLFEEMKNSGLIPTCITFIGVLFACSHAGLVDEGRHYFDLMIFNYGISPSVEHSTCMVDLLGRAGHLDEAEAFLINSPFSSEPTIWRTLLSACGVHKDMDVGVRAAETCLRLEPHVSSTYVLLSNIYASKYLWCEVTRIRNLMRDMGVEKEPGCSWIEIRNKVYIFVADKPPTPKDEIVETLLILMVHLKTDAYVTDTSFMLHDVASAL
ncbi:pentatricopeptide repeat-containing protein At2g27610-like [Tasmannia lanceolata]|uniref:pentatricopeptide repeat-containing protein At2g27610-like n=1 Tax=Tasmannia lanceolata TaxID=3420 RepID=UPI0040641C7A